MNNNIIINNSLSIQNTSLLSEEIVVRNEANTISQVSTPIFNAKFPTLATPLTDHEVKPTGLHELVRHFKNYFDQKMRMGDEKEVERISKHEKAALKTSLISILNKFAMNAMAIIVATAAIGVVIALIGFPPLGIVLGLTLGLIGFTVIITASALNYGNSREIAKIRTESAEAAQQAATGLMKFNTLFKEYPNIGDGTSFVEMLNTFVTEQLQSTDSPEDFELKIEDLEKYSTLFEKESCIRLRNEEKENKLGKENEIIQNDIKNLKKYKKDLEEHHSDQKTQIQLSQTLLTNLQSRLQKNEAKLKANQKRLESLEGLPHITNKDNLALKDDLSYLKRELIAPMYKDQKHRTKLTKHPEEIEKWETQPSAHPVETYKVDLKADTALCMFGKYAKKPQLSAETAAALDNHGYHDEYNVLSNSYQSDTFVLHIDGENYKSVTHYLLAKKATRLSKHRDISPILNASTAKEALRIAGRPPYNIDSLSDTDYDLKRALFCKFVRSDNFTATEAGVLLLDTGSRKLIAGYEAGDPCFGAKFEEGQEGQMTGQNRLGNYLTFIRQWLIDKEEGHHTPFPTPKLRDDLET